MTTAQSSAPRARRPAERPVARLQLDPTICRGHGICAAAAPDLISLDEWGYPILTGEVLDRAQLAGARRAADLCPALALRLRRAPR